jgi:hypothetical protein
MASRHALQYSTSEVRHTADGVLSGLSKFSSPDLITTNKDRFTNQLSPNTRAGIPKKKLRYNDNGFGVFSFDRAAQGMYRLSEYYSPSLDRKCEDVEVEKCSQAYCLISDGSEVEKRLETRPDGKPRLRTTQKKVFQHFEKKTRSQASVHIYVSCGNFSTLSNEDFLYSAMPAIIIAEACAKASIPCKVDLVIGWRYGAPSGQTKHRYAAAVVPLKDYNDPLDVNQFALLSTDPAFWRFEGFMDCLALIHKCNPWTGTYGYGGYGLTGPQIQNIFESVQYKTDTQNRFYTGRYQSKREALVAAEAALQQINNSLSGSNLL